MQNQTNPAPSVLPTLKFCPWHSERSVLSAPTGYPSLIAWHTGRMKLLSWQSWSLEIKDVGRFTSRICNTGRMKLKFQVFVKLLTSQLSKQKNRSPVRNKIIIPINLYLLNVDYRSTLLPKLTVSLQQLHKRTAVKGHSVTPTQNTA